MAHASADIALDIRKGLDVGVVLFGRFRLVPTTVITLPPSFPAVRGEVVGVIEVTNVRRSYQVLAEGNHLRADVLVGLEPIQMLADPGLHGNRQDIHEHGSNDILTQLFPVVPFQFGHLVFPLDQTSKDILALDLTLDDLQDERHHASVGLWVELLVQQSPRFSSIIVLDTFHDVVGKSGSAIAQPDVEVDGLLTLRGVVVELVNFFLPLLKGLDEGRKAVAAFLDGIKEVTSPFFPFRWIVFERLEIGEILHFQFGACHLVVSIPLVVEIQPLQLLVLLLVVDNHLDQILHHHHHSLHRICR